MLSATREAVSPEESFLCIPSPETPGTFSVQTVREKFFTIAPESKVPEIRGVLFSFQNLPYPDPSLSTETCLENPCSSDVSRSSLVFHKIHRY